MSQEKYVKLQHVLEKQEELLRFEHFSNKDAWELGCYLTNKVYSEGIEMAIAIRRLTGSILFQHCTDKTSMNNQNWMNRKFNTVRLMECSSLKAWAKSAVTGETIARHGLTDNEYVFCGGGFPVRLQTGELVAVITVSNLPHQLDHEFITNALSEWLKVEDVPGVTAFFD